MPTRRDFCRSVAGAATLTMIPARAEPAEPSRGAVPQPRRAPPLHDGGYDEG